MTTSMKAVRAHGPGGPSVLKVEDAPIPVTKSDEVKIEVGHAGVNMVDTYWRRALPGYSPESWPFIPGMEAGGVVVETGSDVDDLKVGDRVVAIMHRGSYAEYFTCPAWKVVPVPPEIEMHTAVAVALQGFTASFLTNTMYQVKKEDRILVHAAAGGVGGHIAAMAAERGAHVFGTCSTAQKAKRAERCGCQETIRYDKTDFVRDIQRFTNGEGVHVVYDSVGQTTFLKSLECLRPRGLMCLFGQSSGEVLPVDPQLLRKHGSLFLTRPTLIDYIRPRSELLRIADNVFRIDSPVMKSLNLEVVNGLEGAIEAHMRLQERLTTGKLIIDVRK